MCEECYGVIRPVEEKRDARMSLPHIDAVACVFRGDRVLLHLAGDMWQFPRTTIAPFETMEKSAMYAARAMTGMTAEFTHMAFAQEHIDEPTKTHTILLYVIGKYSKGLIDTKREHSVRFFSQEGIKEVIIEPLTAHALAQFAARPTR